MPEFYVKSFSKKLVPAVFLRYRGQPISDPNTAVARAITLYNADGTPAGVQNTNSYLIAPAGVTLEMLQVFGATVARSPSPAQYPVMISAFELGGTFDLQRQYKYADGTKGNFHDPVMAFQNATSFGVGAATASAGLPLFTAKIGGGFVNRKKGTDQSGEWWNNPANVKSMDAGYSYQQQLKASAKPFRLNELQDGKNFFSKLDTTGRTPTAVQTKARNVPTQKLAPDVLPAAPSHDRSDHGLDNGRNRVGGSSSGERRSLATSQPDKDSRRAEIEAELRKPHIESNYWRDPVMQDDYRSLLEPASSLAPLMPYPTDAARKVEIEAEMRKGRAGAYFRVGSFLPEEYLAILRRETDASDSELTA